jgi:hypothetical protein
MSSPSFDGPRRSRQPWILGALAVAVVIVIVLVVTLTSGGNASPTVGAGGRPIVVMTPSPGSSSYRDAQQIQLSVGPNKYFVPYTRIVVLECADSGGQTSNLPKSDVGCDGNTVQGFSILVNKDGSFSTDHYQLFSLPNTVLGEPADNRPVCNQSQTCVLYVGQDQTNFTAPKVFSAPFTIVATNVPKAPKR